MEESREPPPTQFEDEISDQPVDLFGSLFPELSTDFRSELLSFAENEIVKFADFETPDQPPVLQPVTATYEVADNAVLQPVTTTYEVADADSPLSNCDDPNDLTWEPGPSTRPAQPRSTPSTSKTVVTSGKGFDTSSLNRNQQAYYITPEGLSTVPDSAQPKTVLLRNFRKPKSRSSIPAALGAPPKSSTSSPAFGGPPVFGSASLLNKSLEVTDTTISPQKASPPTVFGTTPLGTTVNIHQLSDTLADKWKSAEPVVLSNTDDSESDDEEIGENVMPAPSEFVQHNTVSSQHHLPLLKGLRKPQLRVINQSTHAHPWNHPTDGPYIGNTDKKSSVWKVPCYFDWGKKFYSTNIYFHSEYVLQCMKCLKATSECRCQLCEIHATIKVKSICARDDYQCQNTLPRCKFARRKRKLRTRAKQ